VVNHLSSQTWLGTLRLLFLCTIVQAAIMALALIWDVVRKVVRGKAAEAMMGKDSYGWLQGSFDFLMVSQRNDWSRVPYVVSCISRHAPCVCSLSLRGLPNLLIVRADHHEHSMLCNLCHSVVCLRIESNVAAITAHRQCHRCFVCLWSLALDVWAL
jgi:hypothetical protein